jgi:hypothetical protein
MAQLQELGNQERARREALEASHEAQLSRYFNCTAFSVLPTCAAQAPCLQLPQRAARSHSTRMRPPGAGQPEALMLQSCTSGLTLVFSERLLATAFTPTLLQ